MKTLSLFLAVSAAAFAPTFAGDVCISSGGHARARIVVADKADKAARFAAAELKWHLNRITGASFEVVAESEADKGDGLLPICVGPSSVAKVVRGDFAPQEWLVDVSAGRIVLAGRDKPDQGAFTLVHESPEGVVGKGWPGFYDEQGTMYAVYDFLERDCGVVWADAEDDGTFIPSKPDLSVAETRRRERPFISFRGGSATFPARFDNSFFKWGTPKFGEYRRLAYAHPKSCLQQNTLFLLRHRAGGRLANANHSFYHYYDKYWREGSKNFIRKWPEIFAKGYPGKEPPQMCYSSPEFIDLVVRDIRAYFDQDPETGKFGWGPDNYCLEGMDNSSFCLCDRCRPQYEPERSADNGAESTYWFRFVKAVADEIAKTHPGKQISTLAYHSHEALPHGVKLPKNVVVYFCLYANRMPYAKVFVDQMDRIRRWREAYPDQPMALWLYNTFPKENANNAGFDFYPAFFADDAYAQYQFFKRHDIRAGIFQCGLNGAVDTYMQLRWMINPDLTPDAMLDEYFSVYGRPGRHLKEFYRRVAARYCDKSRYPKGGVMHQSAQMAWGSLGTQDLMDELAEIMKRAEAAAETPVEKRRLAVWRFGVWDFMRGGRETFAKRQSVPKPSWGAGRIASCGGDVAKVDWASIPPVRVPMYNVNSERPAAMDASMRIAHDGEWLYLELGQRCDTSLLVVSPQIVCFDTWEFFIAGQESLPYRHYYSGPDGRMNATSNGEINWRQGVPATESGPEAFGGRCVSDRSDPKVWTQRFAFPLGNLIDRPLKTGDSFFANFVRVVNKKLSGADSYIQTAVPCTTVHETDRLARITLLPEITWSVMHPTAIDVGYMRRVAAKAQEYGGVDSFEVCGRCRRTRP